MNQPQQHPITNLEQLFEELDAGVFGQKAARALSDVALGVINNERSVTGEVALIFKVKRIGNSRQVEVAHCLKYTRPTANGKASEENTTSTPLYVGQRGALTLIPDTQQKLFDGKA